MAIPNSRYNFNSEGSEQLRPLRQMGATWFVSYAYYNYINNEHTNWTNVSTTWRLSAFSKSKEDHCLFLFRIMEMNENKLGSKDVGLSGFKVKQMAKEIIKKINCTTW